MSILKPLVALTSSFTSGRKRISVPLRTSVVNQCDFYNLPATTLRNVNPSVAEFLPISSTRMIGLRVHEIRTAAGTPMRITEGSYGRSLEGTSSTIY